MYRLILLLSCIAVSSCTTRPVSSTNEFAPKFNNHPKIQIKKGFSGILKLPEMLCYCIADSCNPKDRANTTSNAITNLYAQLSKYKLKTDGPLGQVLIYKDSVLERFECVMPILELPKKNPEKGQLVFLESGFFYVYHHFGAYETLDQAYKLISIDIQNRGLKVCGPVREFYITSIDQTPDESQWITRILIPVFNNIP